MDYLHVFSQFICESCDFSIGTNVHNYCARYIDARVWDEEKQTFVAVLSGEPTDVDACLLLMAELGFVEAMDPKYIATVNVRTSS